MSCEIVLVPLALAVGMVASLAGSAASGAVSLARFAVTEGVKGINNITRAEIETDIFSERELIRIISQAGYDIIGNGTFYKTECMIENKPLAVNWGLGENGYIAEFLYKSEMEAMNTFIGDIEKAAGRRLFKCNGFRDIPIIKEQVIPTVFSDGDILLKTLQGYGLNPQTKENGTVVCSINKSSLEFSKDISGTYILKLKEFPDMEKAKELIANIDSDYKHNVQEQTYESMKQKLSQHNMKIESEEILEDNSIVLTIELEQ